MAEITLRSREQILGDLVRTIIANSDYTDFAPGSTLATLLEAVASVMYQNFLMVLKLLESTDLESMTGVDLDRKAAAIGLPNGTGGVGRRAASPSNGPIEISDPRNPKLSSKLYAGKPAPYAGGTVVYVEDASAWPTPGATQPKLYIGRGTASGLEGPIKYVSKTDNGVFWTLQLEGPLTKNHSISETVVLAQGGDRVIPAGTTVQTTPNSSTPAVAFTIDAQAVIFDGEESTTATCTSTQFGEAGNALAGAINAFGSSPFPQAAVRNTTTFANGRSTENDEELRQRIRDYPATLARGTRAAITAALLGLRDPDTGKAIASVVVIEPTEAGEPSKIFINDGSLLEPTFSGQPYELFVKDASGQEVFFRTTYAPVTPCVAIGAREAPFALEDLMSITITIDGVNETLTVSGTEYQNLETATALEVVRDLNSQANICSFRTISGAKGIVAFDLSGRAESMVVQPGDLQEILGLPTNEIRPIYLYKDGESLSFKGKTATLTTAVFPWSVTAADLVNVVVKVDSSTQVITITDADFAEFFTNISTASLSNWVEVFKKKINGVKFESVGSRIVWSTFQTYTSDSYLEIGSTSARPGIYRSVGGEIVVTTDADYGINSGIAYNQLVTVFNCADSSLDGEYLAKINTVSGVTQITIASSLTSSGSLYWLHSTNSDAGWVGTGKMWTTAESSQGTTKDYSFNRFTGEIRLSEKPNEGALIEVGSLSTRAKIQSEITVGGLYTIPANIFGNAKIVVGFDNSFEIKDLAIGVSSKVSVSKPAPASSKIVRLTALDGVLVDSTLFANAVAGDWIYLVNYTGSGWDSLVGGLYQIKRVDATTTWIDIEVDASNYAVFDASPTTHDVIAGSLFLFSSGVIPQVVDFGAVSTVTVDQVVDIINAQIHSGTAEKISAEQFLIRTNDYINGSICIFAVIGNASVLLGTGQTTNVQAHVASVQTQKVDGGFPVISNMLTRTIPGDGFGTRGALIVDANYTDILDDATNPSIEAASVVTTYPKGYQEYFQTGRLFNYTGRIYNTSNVTPFSGIMRGEEVLRPAVPFDTAIDTGVVQNHRNISLRMRDLSVTKDDKLVVELDLNSVEKTIIVPMHKKAVIETCANIAGGGNAYVLDFTLQDPDDADKPFFDIYSTYKTFNLNDFRILTKAVGCYKFSGDGVALIHRSKEVEAANRTKLVIRYPSAPDKSDVTVSHRTAFSSLVPDSVVSVELSSGPLVAGSFLNVGTLDLSVTPVGGVCDIEFTGSSLDPTKYTVNDILKFGGSHPLSGAYRITAVSGSSVTARAPGLMRYKTTTITGCTAYTTSGSNTILVSKTNHGLLTGDKANITAAGPIDGISQVDLSVASATVTYISSSAFSYTAAAAANAAPSGPATIQFPYYTRLLTITPGSAEVVVTHSGHQLLGGEGIDVSSNVAIGGISAINLSQTNAIVTYVSATQYKYTAAAAAPINTGNINASRSHTGLSIMTTNGSNVVTVTHNSHKYVNGAVLTFSGAVPPTGSSLLASAFNGLKTITYLTANSYTYIASGTETGTPSVAGTVNAAYGPYTMAATTGNGTNVVTMTYSGHGLDNGATVSTSAAADIGGIPAGNLTVPVATIVLLTAASFTFTATASTDPWSATIAAVNPKTGPNGVRRTSRLDATLSVPHVPPPGSNSVTATCSDHRIHTSEPFYIDVSATIGGMSISNLENGGAAIYASSILTNSFVYVAPGYGSSLSGSMSFLRLISLQAAQYPLSSYPLNATKNTIANVSNKINTYALTTSEVSPAGTVYTVTKATYDSHSASYNALMENFIDMETAYDYHGFANKISGSAAIYDYNPTGGYIRALVQSDDAIFPTLAEGTDGIATLYTPVGEEVYIVPSNGNTLSRWMGFSSISSLSAQSSVEATDSTQKVQISSKVVGFSGAVEIKGVTANAAEMFVIGNASVVYDPFQSETGLLGATKVAVDSASSAFVPTGAMVKVTNSLPSSLLRPYRYLPTGSSITSANSTDIVTFFRPTNYVQYAKIGSSRGRIAFYRNGMGPGQTEPMTFGGAINVTFASIGNDRVKITTNLSGLSARVGDMMVIFGDIQKAVVSADQQGGSVVRYTMGAGVKASDFWTGLSVTVSGFTTIPGFNGTFTVTTVASTYFEVSNATLGNETPTNAATVTVSKTNLPFSAFPKIVCKTLSGGYSSSSEYMGYPVVQVNGTMEIIVIAPSIAEEIVTNGGPITITINPSSYPLHKKLMVFLPAIYNEKNIRTNRKPGTMYETTYNSGQIKVLVRKLFGNFVSIWVQNSAAENTDDMKLSNMLVNTDDWLVCNDEFELANRGTFRIVAHNGRSHFIVYNPTGGTDEYLDLTSGGSTEWLVGPFTLARPLRVLDAECLVMGDKLRITSANASGGAVSWFPDSLIGSFTIFSTGYSLAADPANYASTFDTTLLCPAVDITMTSAPATSDVNGGVAFILGANATAVSFQRAAADTTWRYVAGRTVDSADRTKGHLYLLPEISSFQITADLGSKISCLHKLGADQSVVRGIDSYLTFAGLIREAHRVVDGNPSNVALYPGVRAAGTSIEILTPLVKSIFVRLQVKPKDGVDSSIIAETVRATVAGYINKLSVGKPVILSEIIRVVQSLPGVFSVVVLETLPTAQGDRIVVGDVEKAVVFDAESDVVVS